MSDCGELLGRRSPLPPSNSPCLRIDKRALSCYNPAKIETHIANPKVTNRMPILNSSPSHFLLAPAPRRLPTPMHPFIRRAFNNGTWAFSKTSVFVLSPFAIVHYLRHPQTQKARKGPLFRLRSDFVTQTEKLIPRPYLLPTPRDAKPATHKSRGRPDATALCLPNRVPLSHVGIGDTVVLANRTSRRINT